MKVAFVKSGDWNFLSSCCYRHRWAFHLYWLKSQEAISFRLLPYCCVKFLSILIQIISLIFDKLTIE